MNNIIASIEMGKKQMVAFSKIYTNCNQLNLLPAVGCTVPVVGGASVVLIPGGRASDGLIGQLLVPMVNTISSMAISPV